MLLWLTLLSLKDQKWFSGPKILSNSYFCKIETCRYVLIYQRTVLSFRMRDFIQTVCILCWFVLHVYHSKISDAFHDWSVHRLLFLFNLYFPSTKLYVLTCLSTAALSFPNGPWSFWFWLLIKKGQFNFTCYSLSHIHWMGGPKSKFSYWFAKLIKEIVSDSNSIFLWHESELINKKGHFQNFSWFTFYFCKLCTIICIGIAP